MIPDEEIKNEWSSAHPYKDWLEAQRIDLADLLTGERHQVTNMPEGTKALFPHFRSDGWIYFLMTGPDGDRALATDAVLHLAKGN